MWKDGRRIVHYFIRTIEQTNSIIEKQETVRK